MKRPLHTVSTDYWAEDCVSVMSCYVLVDFRTRLCSVHSAVCLLRWVMSSTDLTKVLVEWEGTRSWVYKRAEHTALWDARAECDRGIRDRWTMRIQWGETQWQYRKWHHFVLLPWGQRHKVAGCDLSLFLSLWRDNENSFQPLWPFTSHAWKRTAADEACWWKMCPLLLGYVFSQWCLINYYYYLNINFSDILFRIKYLFRFISGFYEN